MYRVAGVIALVIVVLGGWYWWAHMPAIAFVQPAGGEAWQPGETHTIAWSSRGFPASYKIAISIRRIPPPPLPQEGQEFDPIIFTNLPNTGTTTWTIDPMYPDGTYVLGITAYKSTPVTDPISAESAEFTISHPQLSSQLPPLYSGVSWSASKTENVTIGTTTYSGTSISSIPVTDTMDPGSVFMPFNRYYDNKLKALGWSEANDLAAGGHVGGETGYRKGDAVILVSFHIDYHVRPQNAPTECPCDVILSLFFTK